MYDQEQRIVFGANTYQAFARMLASSTEESEVPLRSHDLELIESRTRDGHTQELIYRPTLH